MASRQIEMNIRTEKIEIRMGTSDSPKKLQRKPLTKYSTGLNLEIICQVGGNIDML